MNDAYPGTTPTASSASPEAGAFVGRDHELRVLRAALHAGIAGQGRLLLVAGEPGIGKSRLLAEVAAEARAAGATVVWGRCWEAGGAPPYWPWIQFLRGLLSEFPPGELLSKLDRGAANIAQVVPELADPAASQGYADDPQSARFRLFDAVSGLLTSAASRRPLALLLDDLHVADTPSLLLLRFIARETTDAGILLVAAYRDTEVPPDHPLSDTLADLLSQPVTQTLQLSGLSGDDVARLIEQAAGPTAAARLADLVHGATEGNALFVSEIARLLASEGLPEPAGEQQDIRLSAPPGLRDVILRRIRRLPEQTQHALTLASVLGRDWDASTLADLVGLSPEVLATQLEPARQARLVSELASTFSHARFTHSLVRDAIYDQLSVADRMELHRRAGEALEARYAGGPEEHLAQLAHHFVLATPAGRRGRAVRYSQRAAERALGQLAYEEAVRLYGLALDALSLEDRADLHSRAELLIGLGEAQARAGDGVAARSTFRQAAEAGRQLQDGPLLAQAALGYGGRFLWARAGTDRVLVPLLEEALNLLPVDDSSLRVRVMSRLAGALRDQADRGPRDRLSREAVDMAKRLGDPRTLAYALDARYFAIFWPENPRQRLELGRELVAAAEKAGDMERAASARFIVGIGVPLELGDVGQARVALESVGRLSDELRQPAQLWLMAVCRATIALFDGRFSEARSLVEEALALGQRAQPSDALLSHRVQSFTLEMHCGDVAKLESTIRQAVGEFPARPMFRCMLAYMLAETGRAEEAGELLGELAEDGFVALPRTNEWLFSLGFLADVAGRLGEAEAARAIHELLLPFATRNASTPDYIATGSVSRPLAVAAGVAGMHDQAERHFGAALAQNRRMGGRPWVARTMADWAEALLRRDGAAEEERAARLIGEALALARELGMVPLERRLERLNKIGGVKARPADKPKAAAAAQPMIFRRAGEYWEIGFGGGEFRLKDSKGLRYIARLLAEPDREFHVLDLVAAERPRKPPAGAVSQPGALSREGDAGPHLDDTARNAYRLRLGELEQEIDEAIRFGDAERSARAVQEREFLEHELTAAYGLGGRARKAAAPAERARVSVTQAIKAALRRVDAHTDELGKHLRGTIRTGTYCSYRPDPRAPTAWRL